MRLPLDTFDDKGTVKGEFLFVEQTSKNCFGEVPSLLCKGFGTHVEV